MKKKSFLVLLLSIVCTAAILAGGASEGGSSSTHGKYLAGKGTIVEPGYIHEDAYIAQIDYDYPTPVDRDFAVYVYSGNRQLSNMGQQEYLQIGLKARKMEFSELPPMNLAFVIDRSGSMNNNEKIEWVKDSFELFIEKVREVDYVSLVTFSNDADVVFKSTKMNSERKTKKFLSAVESIEAGGGTNLTAGLEAGYTQVMSNFRDGYINRVLFLTDGRGPSQWLSDMAETYKAMGVNVSTIGLGSDFDVNLMVELAKAGGGSSRFISDREVMRKTFSDELDRMVVPAARNVQIRVEFPEYIKLSETWGYNNTALENGVLYSLPTIHNGDYETILAEIDVLPSVRTGINEVARVIVEYDSLYDQHVVLEPSVITSDFVSSQVPVFGVSNYSILKASTMLYVARSMKTIGAQYYSTQRLIERLNEEKNNMYRDIKSTSDSQTMNGQEVYDSLTSDQIKILESEINTSFLNTIEYTRKAKSIVLNNRMKLDNEGFEDELLILDKYIDILAKDLNVADTEVSELKEPVEIYPVVENRSLDSYLGNLFNELYLSMKLDAETIIAVAPFLQSSAHMSDFTEYVNQSAVMSFSQSENIKIVDRSRLEDILSEQKMALAGLTDTENALKIGELLSAHCLVTGNVIPMKESVVVFSRALDVETGEVIAVSQAIIPKSDSISAMINAF
ncbi:MAG: VWA domain-containing protein [Spirochaetales bacterium]|nr:VWA domain-containing protein [Spirochaetales bacterium]